MQYKVICRPPPLPAQRHSAWILQKSAVSTVDRDYVLWLLPILAEFIIIVPLNFNRPIILIIKVKVSQLSSWQMR